MLRAHSLPPGWRRPSAAVTLAAVLTAGCAARETSQTSARHADHRDGPQPTAAVPADSGFRFRTQELPFRYDRGETGAAWPVEVTGGGVGMLDYDGDGDLDLFFAQGGPLTPGGVEVAPGPADVLLRNDGGGKFADASAEAGLTRKGYGQGVAVADYDGDGDPDVYVTRYGRNTLWRNDGGRFADATDVAGVGIGRWSLGAAFFDADGDGDLDLFVANYFDFDPAQAPFDREPDTGAARYGPPGAFVGQPDVLFRNEGGGRFADVTAKAGVAGTGRGMGVLAADFDGDGRADLLVANDAEANALWRNNGDGTFEDVAHASGLAYNGKGQPEANMGIARADVDLDGVQDVAITHFVNEHTTLWLARPASGGSGVPFFEDQTRESGLAPDSRPVTGWGVALVDFDRDGLPDLFQTNGHIRAEKGQRYERDNPPRLWRNLGKGRFALATGDVGPYFTGLYDGRGAAAGDLDGDGDPDLVVVHHHVPSVVLWNDTPPCGSSLRLRLRGDGGNRDAVGATIKAEAGGRTFAASVDGGGGYLSANDPTVVIGLGPVKAVDRVTVRWPSGKVETRTGTPVDAVVEWAEPVAAGGH